MEIQSNYDIVLLSNTKCVNFNAPILMHQFYRMKKQSSRRRFRYCELYFELYFAILNTEIRFKQE